VINIFQLHKIMGRRRIQLDDLTRNNLGVLRRINSVVLPATYSDKWYEESLSMGELAKLAFYDDLPVGAIRCSLETPQKQTAPTRIYIMTLAVLAPYRGYGIGTLLLNHVIEQAKSMYLHEISVHVWVDNEDEVVEWYEKRGFTRGELVKGYYQKMDPKGDAYIMTKRF
jgi:ribosomal protein S18 acetylase RimI-like enzyme